MDMIRQIGGGHTTVSRIFSQAIVTVLFGALFASPLPIVAQGNPTDFLLFGVNLSGTSPWMNDKGQTLTSGVLATPDSRLILNIPAGIFIRNAAGLPQPFVSATLVANPPAAPSQQIMIIAYELGTPGATFNPTVGLKFWYPDAALPPSVAESGLYIAEWNGSAWVKLPSVVDPAGNTVATSIASFTTYALFGSTQPPPTTNTTPPPTTPLTTQTTSQTTTAAIPPSSTNSSGFLTDSPLTIFLLIGAAVLIVVLFLIARKQ